MSVRTIWLLLGLTAACGLCMPAVADEQKPLPAGQLVDQAYQTLMLADRARDNENWVEAARLYRNALNAYTNVSARHPDWQPKVVKYRVAYCNTELERATQFAGDAQAAATTNAPAVPAETNAFPALPKTNTVPSVPQINAPPVRKWWNRVWTRRVPSVAETNAPSVLAQTNAAPVLAETNAPAVPAQTNAAPAVSPTHIAAEIAATPPPPPLVMQEPAPMERIAPREGKAKALTLLEKGDATRAARILTAVLRGDPDDLGARLMMGVVRCQTFAFEDALFLLQSLVQDQPDNAVVHMALATAYFGLGQRTDAAGEMKRALEINPDLGPAHFDMAQILLFSSPPDLEGVRRHYRQALDLGCPPDPSLDLLLQ